MKPVRQNRAGRCTVYIRADGGSSTGLGHLTRCIALGQMLAKYYKIVFVCKEVPESIIKEFKRNKFSFAALRGENDFFAMLKGGDIVVLDGYDFTYNYELRIKKKQCALVTIDDLHKRKFAADIIINHAPGVTRSDYNALPATRFVLGPQYALLRKSFLKEARNRRRSVGPPTALICFGGSDPLNLTERAVKVVQDFHEFKKVNIVTGASYNHKTKLDKIIKKDSRAIHHHAVSEAVVQRLMAESKLCIVPSSGLLFEALASGCEVVSGMYVKNQKNIFEAFRKKGAFESAGRFEESNLRKAISSALKKKKARKKIIDGYSSERILKMFLSLN